MEYPFYPFGYGFIPIVHDSSREYFDSLPEETQLALLRQDITAGDFEGKLEELRRKE